MTFAAVGAQKGKSYSGGSHAKELDPSDSIGEQRPLSGKKKIYQYTVLTLGLLMLRC